MRRVGVIVGLASEVRVLGTCPQVRVACSGASACRAWALAFGLVASGCDALASFGLAGGLDPALASGALCLPEAVMTPAGRRLAVDTRWRAALLARIGETQDRTPLLIGRDEPASSPQDKRALFASTGAAAIDMESHAVAEVAGQRGIPFLVIRAVADPAERLLPEWLTGVIGESGRPRLRVLLKGLAAHPGDALDLIRLAADARRGLATLSRVAAGAGPLLAFPV